MQEAPKEMPNLYHMINERPLSISIISFLCQVINTMSQEMQGEGQTCQAQTQTVQGAG